LSFVQDLLKRYLSSGKVEPKSHGGGQTAKLSQEQVALVAILVEEDNDAILVELCERLEQRTGVRVSRATMGRITQKLKLTRKKNIARERKKHRAGAKVEGRVLEHDGGSKQAPTWYLSMKLG
jgi:transposase